MTETETKIFSPEKLDELSSKNTWAIDVDDCIYDIACGLHSYIKQNIVRTYNSIAQHDPNRQAIAQTLSNILKTQNITIEDPQKISILELGSAFPPIVRALNEVKNSNFFEYLDQFYGDKYDKIEPDTDLVHAFSIAHKKGININIYTNGPSSPVEGISSHLQKILHQRGFNDHMIEHLRKKTYDLLMQIRDGYGKPSPMSMQNFFKFSGAKPEKTLMADDSLQNLKTASDFGVAPIWTWTSDQKPIDTDIEIAKNINAPRVRKTGAALLEIALAH